MHVMGSVSPGNEMEFFKEKGVAIAVTTSPPSPPSPPSRLSNIEVMRPPAPPPPPPPPPPPLPPPAPLLPPPPLPPLLPGLGDPAEGLRKKKRVRSFFWKTIPEEQVKGRANLWTQGRAQQQYQIDVQTIEELFGQNDSQSNAKATPTRGGKARSSFRETKEEVSILDGKRGMNIGIFLKQFKRSNQMIVDDICHGNSEPYGAEPLRELLKLLPETEEVKKLKAYRGDVSKLSLADSFVYLLIQLPSYVVRIESMLLKEEFPGECEAMKRDIKILRSATEELMCCEELHAVLHLVLQAGNILNAGGYAGNAVGFKLSSLLSLADTKANKPGMNLLHFVALEAQKKDEKLLEFPLRLSHIKAAARISLETLDTELHWLTSRTRSVEESVQRDTELLQQLDNFLQCATSSLCSLRGSRQQLKKEADELLDFFCEDRETFRLDDCFSIFKTFCTRFTDAVKDNTEREVKEAARRRRLQELEEQKRHSWAGGEEVGGAFGLRCSSEADMNAAMSRHDEAGLLMELLMPRSRPRSPLLNSPLRRSGSLRRSRNSPSSSPFISAECEPQITNSDHKVQQMEDRTGLSPQSLGVKTCSFPKNQQSQAGEIAPQTSPPNMSPKNKNAHHTTTNYLSYEANQTLVEGANKSTVKPTSDYNRQPTQSDHNNNGHESFEEKTTQMSENSEKSNQEKSESGSTMSVVVEKHTLVPELKAFATMTTPTSRNNGHRLRGYNQDDVVITDVEEQRVEDSHSLVKSDTSSSSSRREEEEGHQDKVVVWCVTGVCEPVHTDNAHSQNDSDECVSDNQGGNTQPLCAAANDTPSDLQPANEKPVPVPISSQPVPVSSTKWRPAQPALTTDAFEEEPAKHGNGNKTVKVVQNTSSTIGKSEPPSKKLPTSKAPPSATKPSKSKLVRTLTTSENQGMRRVVLISRPARGALSLCKQPDKPPGNHRGSSSPASSLTIPNRSSVRRGERPSTAPSSRRSSINKPQDPKDSLTQSQDLQRKPSVRKPVEKRKPHQEEKMCRSTLRALSQSGGEGGGGGSGSVSAPTTPLHKPSSSPLPGFARSTASSSFRRTHTTLAAPAPPLHHSPHSSSNSSTKVSSSSPNPPPFTRTGSLRVSTTSKSSDLKSSPSIKVPPPPRSPLHDSLATPKGHRRTDSGSFSDKSAQSGKDTRPSWR